MRYKTDEYSRAVTEATATTEAEAEATATTEAEAEATGCKRYT